MLSSLDGFLFDSLLFDRLWVISLLEKLHQYSAQFEECEVVFSRYRDRRLLSIHIGRAFAAPGSLFFRAFAVVNDRFLQACHAVEN